jgi:peptidoglycan/xylan/chitin deacetylase (PgdA/CDA1 family)
MWLRALIIAAIILFAGAVLTFHPPAMPHVLTDVEHAKELSSEAVLQRISTDPKTPESVQVPILIYHNVRPDYPKESYWQKQFSITPDLLLEQFAYLHTAGYTVISMDQLSDMIRAGTTSPVQKPVVITFDDGWESQYQYAFPLLKQYGYTATFYIYTNAINAYPSAMTWDQLRQLLAAGMTIGDHTVSHPRLSGLTDAQRKVEIGDARTELQQRLGVSVNHFASPYGYADDALAAQLKNMGFTTGRTTYKGSFQSEAMRYQLRAYLVKRDFAAFKKYLSGT